MSTDTEERRARYRALCEREPTVPLFSRAFWLDAVCGPDAWDVALVLRGDEMAAALPYTERRLRGLRMVVMPQLTQTAGPWLRASTARYPKRLAQEKELLNELIERLETQCRFAHFSQRFHHTQTNWLPFYWCGYKQTTRYTYILEDLSDVDALWTNLQENIRREIRKAEGRSGLRVRIADDVQELLRVNSMTFARQEGTAPYGAELVRNIDSACRQRECRRILLAEDAQGTVHAAVFLVWDENAAYYLIAGADPDLRTSGAQSLLAWEAIRHAATVTRTFDFEGSMIESIERFVRAFGARQVPYFLVTKSNSVLLELRDALGRVASVARTRWASR